MCVHLNQELDLTDDSFTYHVRGESEYLYRVTCNAQLLRKGQHIGRFKLCDGHWELYLGDELYMASGPNTTFKLPEFELKALTELANSTARPHLAHS